MYPNKKLIKNFKNEHSKKDEHLTRESHHLYISKKLKRLRVGILPKCLNALPVSGHEPILRPRSHQTKGEAGSL
jgi:predicted O-linked N-acetylglucosamine transferase (SPINDLY family)